MELSQKLKVLRKKKGLSQFELAEVLCVSRQAITGWEAGTSRPSTENLQSLSRLVCLHFLSEKDLVLLHIIATK